jgi:hypothetical protein
MVEGLRVRLPKVQEKMIRLMTKAIVNLVHELFIFLRPSWLKTKAAFEKHYDHPYFT